MERKRGIDRLPKLVEAPLAVRFRSQAERPDEAIRSDVSAAVSVQAEAMLRAAKRAFPGAGIEATGPAGATAAIRFDSRASDVATERETQPSRPRTAHSRRSRPAGFRGLYAPLLDPRPEPSSTKPLIDWARGDDIPF